jgi:hypothetical protein
LNCRQPFQPEKKDISPDLAAFAYLDPVTASTVVSASIDIFASVALAVKTTSPEIKGLFVRDNGRIACDAGSVQVKGNGLFMPGL